MKSSWLQVFRYEEVAEYGDGDTPFLNGVSIDQEDWALFAQSRMQQKEELLWTIDQSSEESFAVVYAPSGALKMTVWEFVEFYNSLSQGIFNPCLGKTLMEVQEEIQEEEEDRDEQHVS